MLDIQKYTIRQWPSEIIISSTTAYWCHTVYGTTPSKRGMLTMLWSWADGCVGKRGWAGLASLPYHYISSTEMLVCTALHCTSLQCTALQFTALHCTALHSTTLLCIGTASALHCTSMCFITIQCSIVFELYFNKGRCTALLAWPWK